MITVVGPQWELPDVLARSVQRFGLASEVRATGRPPPGQNARLRGGKAKETEGVTLVSTRHRAPQFPLPPYIGRQFRRSHKFDPATLERDAKEFWGVTLRAMDVVADRYRSLAKARISGGETTDLIKELFPTPKVPAGAKPSAAVPEGCREWHRAYSSLNPQNGKSSMYSPTLPGLFSLLATSHSVLLRSCVLRASSRFQLG